MEESQNSTVRALLVDKLAETAASTFGFSSFRPYQLEAIIELSKGKDVMLVLPTSAGKSLVYSLPPVALVETGTVSIVVSPLLSLARNQIRALDENFGIDARLWASETSLAQQKAIASDLVAEPGSCSVQLLYTTPESLASNRLLKDALSISSDMNKLFCIAVDEAHVVDPWGHDFRPAYLKLHESLKALNNVPVLACTATANQESQERIRSLLCMNANAAVFVGGFDRPEIQLNVVYKELLDQSQRDPTAHYMASFIQERNSSGIIYCRNRTTCDRLKNVLMSYGVSSVLSYHAGLSTTERDHAQEEWEDGEIKCLVCTIAFGLGINKSDVRWVLHYEPPQNMSEFYQQIGRAGRDGELAHCILFASHQDIETMMRKDHREDLGEMKEYLYSGSCRRMLITSHFGKGTACPQTGGDSRCDICRKEDTLSLALEAIQHGVSTNGQNMPQTNDPSERELSFRPSVLQLLAKDQSLTLGQSSASTSHSKKPIMSGFIKPQKRYVIIQVKVKYQHVMLVAIFLTKIL
jgi:ATP-dependent DNA helicase RecQ